MYRFTKSGYILLSYGPFTAGKTWTLNTITNATGSGQFVTSIIVTGCSLHYVCY